MTDRVLRGVLGNFLQSYLSRYSDYQGYWLFGFLVPELTEWRLDLLKPATDDRPVFQYAIDLAEQTFREQLQKGRMDAGQIAEGELILFRDQAFVALDVNGNVSDGWTVRASIAAKSSRGKRFRAERSILVARHNPRAERRSSRVAY